MISSTPLSIDGLGRRILESGGDCLKVLDSAGHVVYLNPAGVAALELRGQDDLLNRPWLDLWDGEHREAAESAVRQAAAGERAQFEAFCRTARGSDRWWDVIVTPVVDDTGAIAHLLVVSRDITARHREETFRRRQHDVLEQIVSGAPLDVLLRELVLLIEQQCEGMLCSILLLDDDGVHLRHGAAPSLPAEYQRAIDGLPIGPQAGSCGAAVSLRRLVIVTDILVDPLWENYRTIAAPHGLRACWSSPILGANRVLGSFAMYYGAPRPPTPYELRLIDIATDLARIAIEHHRAQEALRASEARNRAILRAIPDWMFVLSAAGVFLDYHAKDPQSLLVPPEAFMGRTMREVLPPAIAERLHAAFVRALASGGPEEVEYELGVNSTQRFYQARIVPCESDRVLSMVRDVTDRKRTELDLAVQRRELTHLSRVAMLGELAGTLAHELSQPLTAVLSNAQAAARFLDRDPIDVPELRRTIDDIIRSDRRAAAVIDHLRALLRKSDTVFQPLDINEAVRDGLNLVQSDLVARQIRMTTDMWPGTVEILGDRVQLQQLVLNLVLNAGDAMAHTELADRQLSISTVLDGDIVQVVVTDCGIGIPEQRLDEVFEPFVTFKERGLGLGLAISRSIVTAHQGRISAENNAHGGATFRCTFPLAVGSRR